MQCLPCCCLLVARFSFQAPLQLTCQKPASPGNHLQRWNDQQKEDQWKLSNVKKKPFMLRFSTRHDQENGDRWKLRNFYARIYNKRENSINLDFRQTVETSIYTGKQVPKIKFLQKDPNICEKRQHGADNVLPHMEFVFHIQTPHSVGAPHLHFSLVPALHLITVFEQA